MSIVVGLTGPTGAGKSSVTDVATALGFKVVDCDKLSRVAVEKGSAGLQALVETFGTDILAPCGELDRAALAKKAFCSEDKTRLLNKTLLPFINELVKGEIDTEFVLLDAPTLFEAGADKLCDYTIAVLADNDVRRLRIMERDGINEEAALLRMNAGKNDEFYESHAQKILYNDSDFDKFKREAEEYLKKIIGGN